MCGRVGEVEGERERREGYGKECWRVLRKCKEELEKLKSEEEFRRSGMLMHDAFTSAMCPLEFWKLSYSKNHIVEEEEEDEEEDIKVNVGGIKVGDWALFLRTPGDMFVAFCTKGEKYFLNLEGREGRSDKFIVGKVVMIEGEEVWAEERKP
ncbi:hypothetical protein TrST_g8212 [Triparma strigata]|uniref:Autophagy-related protein 11 C-terminal domain-containing protein n=1 Tax=Triparma strigata TaxID=1606541 RepID=A0A9W6ZGL4_9STRA|nr:hypothetical protein TrST_g8212 [Triparma strigata]